MEKLRVDAGPKISKNRQEKQERLEKFAKTMNECGNKTVRLVREFDVDNSCLRKIGQLSLLVEKYINASKLNDKELDKLFEEKREDQKTFGTISAFFENAHYPPKSAKRPNAERDHTHPGDHAPEPKKQKSHH
uniref:Uncharacterized protein n=1 Tax=Panagrolaimus sp. ES5 TaxID=591445 RepID=A0AC34FFY7_9BILA